MSFQRCNPSRLPQCSLCWGSLPWCQQSFPYRPQTMTPKGPYEARSRGQLRDVVFGGAFSVELLESQAARDTVQYQNFQRQSLTGQALPDLRDNTSMESVQKKVSHRPGLLVDNGSWCSPFPSKLRAEQLADNARSDPKPDCICTTWQLAHCFLLP